MKGRDVGVRILAERNALALRARDGLVVDIGEVDDLPHLPATDILQRAPQDVHADKGAEVPDVPARVDGQPAGVHPDGVVAQGGKRFLLAGQCVEQAHAGLGGNSLPDVADVTTLGAGPLDRDALGA